MPGFFSELNRRNVTRVAAAYAVASWLLTEVASVVLPTFGAPEWVLQVVIALLVLGFPIALVFAWVYELTPEGLRRETDIGPEQSIAADTGRKLNVVVVVLLVLAIGLMLADRFVPREAASPAAAQDASPAPEEDAPSIAVLAFENMSADAENEYFADGVSEEILNLLADVAGLSVASRTSAFAFKGREAPIPEIAAALQVRYVLEGSVRKSGEQVRVTAQLIDAVTDRHLWSETYDRSLEDIFSIQDEIAAAIGGALQLQLLGSGGEEVKAEVLDPEVYAHFLEARYRMRRRTDEDMRAAHEALIDIVAAEPTFGRAHALLGEAYLLQRSDTAIVSYEIASRLARMHAGIARSFNPRLGGVNLLLGKLAEHDGALVEALEHYDRAVELEPEEPRPYHWRGMLYGTVGFTDRCRADLERAVRLDPGNPNVHYALAGCLIAGDEYERAEALARHGATLGNQGGYSLVIQARLLLGDRPGALREWRRYMEMWSDSERWGALEPFLAGTGSEEAMVPSREAGSRPGDIAVALMMEDYEAFLALLGVGDDGLPNRATQAWASPYADLRADHRFVEQMERYGALELWLRIGPPDDCRTEGDGFSCGHRNAAN